MWYEISLLVAGLCKIGAGTKSAGYGAAGDTMATRREPQREVTRRSRALRQSECWVIRRQQALSPEGTWRMR